MKMRIRISFNLFLTSLFFVTLFIVSSHGVRAATTYFDIDNFSGTARTYSDMIGSTTYYSGDLIGTSRTYSDNLGGTTYYDIGGLTGAARSYPNSFGSVTYYSGDLSGTARTYASPAMGTATTYYNLDDLSFTGRTYTSPSLGSSSTYYSGDVSGTSRTYPSPFTGVSTTYFDLDIRPKPVLPVFGEVGNGDYNTFDSLDKRPSRVVTPSLPSLTDKPPLLDDYSSIGTNDRSSPDSYPRPPSYYPDPYKKYSGLDRYDSPPSAPSYLDRPSYLDEYKSSFDKLYRNPVSEYKNKNPFDDKQSPLDSYRNPYKYDSPLDDYKSPFDSLESRWNPPSYLDSPSYLDKPSYFDTPSSGIYDYFDY